MGFFIENAPNFRPVDLSLLATTLNGFLTALIITAIWTFLFVLVHSLGTLDCVESLVLGACSS